MSAQLFPRPAWRPSVDAVPLVGGLALASLLELAILRTFTRTAVHIPGLETLRSPYQALTVAGEYMYFASLALILPVAVLLALGLFERTAPFRALALFGLLLFSVPAALAAFGHAPVLVLDVGSIAAVLVLTAAAAMAVERRRAAWPLACFGLAFALSGSFNALSSARSAGIPLEQSTALLDASELLGLAFALASPLLLRRRGDRVAQRSALVVGAVVLVAFLGNGSTTRFLLLWNVGLSGIVPGFAYALAGAALVFTAVGLVRERSILAAAGLGLLIAGGIGLHSTYQSALVVCGLLALLAAVSQDAPWGTVPVRAETS